MVTRWWVIVVVVVASAAVVVGTFPFVFKSIRKRGA